MSNLHDILDEMLINNGFVHMNNIDEMLQEEYGDYRFFGPEEGTPPSYLLILDLASDQIPTSEKFLKSQFSLYSLLSETISSPSFDKNVYFLVTISNSNSAMLEFKTNDFILKVEEDPYCFKKLVLEYNSESAEMLAKKINESGQDIQSFFTEQINTQANFDSFIKGKNSVYELIANLFIKLPFISLPLQNYQRPIILSEELQKKIKSNNLQTLWEKVYVFKESDINNLSLNSNLDELDTLLVEFDIQEEKK